MDKALPSNTDAERAVLGSVLLNRDAIIAVAAWLQPEDFYLEQHAWIYEAMVTCYNNRVPPDSRTVSDELRRHDRLDTIGGLPYLLGLVDSVPSSYHIEYYAQIVQRTALQRRLIMAGSQIAQIGYDESKDIEDTLDKAESTLFEVSQRRSTQDFIHIGQVIDNYYEQINYLQEHRGEVVGVPTGFRDFDEITGGLQRSDLLILAARPAVGKCLPGHTLIDNPATGERVRLDEYVRRQIPAVCSMAAGGQLRPALIASWVDSGVQPCFRVRTASGRAVEVTAQHPFYTRAGWRPLAQLRLGQPIAVAGELPIFGRAEPLPPELVRLLGYALGCGASDAAPVCPADQQISAEASAIAARFLPGQGQLAAWLAQWGAPQRGFPAQVWAWSRRALAELLRAVVSSAGRVALTPQGAQIHIATPSRQLAADIHHALVRFGVFAALASEGEVWRIRIAQPAAVERYQRRIGWAGQPAPSPVALRAARALAPAAAAYGLPPEALADSQDEPGIAWDAVASIEAIGPHHVYDLTIPHGENFIAQDVVVHNTSFAMSLAHGVASHGNGVVGIFSLEMSRDQLVQRLIAMETGIDTHKLRTGHIRDNQLQTVMEAMSRLASMPIYIEDTAGMSIMEVRSKARRLQSRVGIDLVIIDYLQLMQGRGKENRVQEVSEISRGLKALARELNVPVLALSQLSRAVEGRTSHVPMLSDLRESGSIEQDADIVLFIYREELYEPETDKKGIAEIHLAKHRNGPVGVVPMRFDAATTRFSDLSYRTPEGY